MNRQFSLFGMWQEYVAEIPLSRVGKYDGLLNILEQMIDNLSQEYGYFTVLQALEEATKNARKYTGEVWEPRKTK